MTNFNTRLVHPPVQDDNNTGAVNVPIYEATTFAFPSVEIPGKDDYSRSGNPTRRALEEQLADLEGGVAGFAFASGMAAIHAALAIFKRGDHLIVGQQIYGGTFRLLHKFFQRWGLSITTVDTRDLEAIAAAIRPNTKAIYFEPVTNPLLHVTPIKAVARLAHQHQLLTIVDNTFLSPYLLRPLSWGADIVIHSATKYLAGHSVVSAGAVVVNSQELAQRLYFIQNALGSILSPKDSSTLMLGIKTLGLRLDRQMTNVKQLIHYLHGRPEVQQIYYPGIAGQPDYPTLHQEARGAGGVFSFELDEETVDPVKFVNSLHLFKLAVSLGAVESLVELPSRMSHAELKPAEQRAAGIKSGLIRMAVGIEDYHDQLADIQQAIKHAHQSKEEF